MGIAPTLTLIAGPQLLGFLFNWGLFGVLCVQLYIYHISFPEDPIRHKSLVYGIFLLELTQLVMVTSDAFENFVYGWGKLSAFNSFHTAWFSVPILCGVISGAVQIFFGWRIWVLSKSRLLAGAVVILALFQACAAIVTGIRIEGEPVEEASRQKAVALMWMIGSPVVDALIAATMTFLLTRSKGSFRGSDMLLDSLIRMTVETGLATAVVALVEAVLYAISPDTLLYECPALMITKMYSNTLLAVLNSRALSRSQRQNSSFKEYGGQITSRRFQPSDGNPIPPVRIEVYNDTMVVSDDVPLDRMGKSDREYAKAHMADPAHQV